MGRLSSWLSDRRSASLTAQLQPIGSSRKNQHVPGVLSVMYEHETARAILLIAQAQTSIVRQRSRAARSGNHVTRLHPGCRPARCFCLLRYHRSVVGSQRLFAGRSTTAVVPASTCLFIKNAGGQENNFVLVNSHRARTLRSTEGPARNQAGA